MVRLKELYPTKFVKGSDTFQFLMVRLKEKKVQKNRPKTDISIPYGSIKSSWKSLKYIPIRYFNSLWFD